MQILNSAAKVVFIGLAGAVITGLFTGHITGEQFMTLAAMAFTFYFTAKDGGNDKFDGIAGK